MVEFVVVGVLTQKQNVVLVSHELPIPSVDPRSRRDNILKAGSAAQVAQGDDLEHGWGKAASKSGR